MAQQKDNSGALFVNDRKEKDTHPDSRGSAMIDGVEYWVSAWRKEGKGKRYLSLSFQRKEAAGSRRDDARQGPVGAPEIDDEIPF